MWWNIGGTDGSFTSPYYPSNYCNNHNCYYNITVEEGLKVMLNFTYFDMEEYVDSVRVYTYSNNLNSSACLASNIIVFI